MLCFRWRVCVVFLLLCVVIAFVIVLCCLLYDVFVADRFFLEKYFAVLRL